MALRILNGYKLLSPVSFRAHCLPWIPPIDVALVPLLADDSDDVDIEGDETSQLTIGSDDEPIKTAE